MKPYTKPAITTTTVTGRDLDHHLPWHEMPKGESSWFVDHRRAWLRAQRTLLVPASNSIEHRVYAQYVDAPRLQYSDSYMRATSEMWRRLMELELALKDPLSYRRYIKRRRRRARRRLSPRGKYAHKMPLAALAKNIASLNIIHDEVLVEVKGDDPVKVGEQMHAIWEQMLGRQERK